MKTPLRFLVFFFGMVVVLIVSTGCFPMQTVVVSFYGMMIFLPLMVVIMVWQVIWRIKNPPPRPPPPHYCHECNQILPESENEQSTN